MQWTKDLVDKTKREAKASLDPFADQPGARLRQIHSFITQYSNSSKSKDQLLCFIYIMSALVHHERNGGIKSNQLAKYVAAASDILALKSIDPLRSKLRFLYHELYLVVSQIKRREGHSWSSAWNLLMSEKYKPALNQTQSARLNLGLGIRNLRLGYMEIARSSFCEVLATTDNKLLRNKATIGLIHSCRLSGDVQQAISILEILANSENDRTEEENLELEYERNICEAVLNGNLQPLVSSVQPRIGSHYRSAYILEVQMWTYAVRQQEWQGKVPKASSIARNKSLNPKSLGVFFDVAKDFQKCLDDDYPLEKRFQMMGDLLDKARQMLTIDRELLVWVCATRWLARNHAYSFAKLCLHQYKTMSNTASSGATDDVLNICSDLFEKNWFVDAKDRTSEDENAEILSLISKNITAA